ncbi:MAG TPA: hypothetical protein VGG06_33155 [Thermoanaerobaculia bacterium]
MHRRSLCYGTAAALVAACLAPAAVAESGRIVGPVIGTQIHADVSPPLRDVKPLPPKAAGFEKEISHQPPPAHGRGNAPGRQDPRRQTEDRPLEAAALTPAPILNFAGLSDDDNAATIGGRVVPPDTNGDIGPDHFVQYINLIWAVWDVTRDVSGAPTGVSLALGPLPGNSFWSGFGGPCQTNNDGDPIVLYDHLADRWLVSQFSINEGIQCVAVSTSPDPTGTYFRYAFTVSPGENNDYPKLGLMPDAYYLSLRDFPSNDGTFAGFVAFDRAALLAGGAVTFVKFSLPCAAGDCPDGVQPPHLEGPAPAAGTPGFFTRFWDDDFDGPLTGTDGVRIWEFDPDFNTPANSTFTELAIVPLPDYDSTVCGFFQRNCIPVPKQGGGSALDPIDELQMYRAQYRSFGGHDSLVINTTVDADGSDTAGILWAELRDTGSGWSLHQNGVYAPSGGLHRWMGSAAMNGFGDVALGYSVANRNTFPSVRYVTRQAADPLGTLPGGEVELIAGTGTQTQANRWGDYSSMSVDPVDDCTFWYTQEYYENTASFDFKTRVGAFGGPSCGAAPPPPPPPPPPPGCDNDGVCESGEDCLSCANDCAGVTSGKPANRFCCGNGIVEGPEGDGTICDGNF